MSFQLQLLAALGGYVLEGWLRYPDRYRHHGIGVLQGYVLESDPPTPEYRIHLWHPTLRMPNMVDSGLMHDHRFDMESTVLYGTVVHTVFQLDPAPNGAYQAWFVQNARAAIAENEKGWLESESELRYNIKGETFKHSVGHTYLFPKRCFHRTDVEGLAITLVSKRNQQDSPARILSRFGTKPKHGFEHEQHVEEVMQRGVITEAIQVLRKLAREEFPWQNVQR